jgi:membrane glycosyltransferase
VRTVYAVSNLRIEIADEPRGKWSVTLIDEVQNSWEEFPPMTVHKVLVLLSQVLKDKRW